LNYSHSKKYIKLGIYVILVISALLLVPTNFQHYKFLATRTQSEGHKIQLEYYISILNFIEKLPKKSLTFYYDPRLYSIKNKYSYIQVIEFWGPFLQWNDRADFIILTNYPMYLMTNAIFFLIIFLLKFSIALLLSSDYQLELFLPFLTNGIQNFPCDPWKLAFENGKIDAFPYHPLLWYLLTLFQLIPTFWDLPSVFQRIFLVLPNFLADLLILKLLESIFPNRKKAILGVYFFSPVILYAVYAHGQLDLLPTAFLFLSVYLLLQRHYSYSGVSFSLALSMKLHVLAVLPLFLFFIYRKSTQKIISFILPLILTFSFISLPWYFSPYFREMVLLNPKQDLLFESIYKIGDYKLLLPFFACFLVYLKFFSYPKVNLDLFLTWLAILFSVFVLTIPPAPGWYIWTLPFLTYFYLKFLRKRKHILYLAGIFHLSYLLFFLFSWKGDYTSLRFLGQEIFLQFTNEKLNGLLFTGLCASLAANLYAVYQLGVRSNLIYYKSSGILIGIGGDSGSGKSTLLHSLQRLLEPSVTLLEGDGDHRWERGHENYQKFTHLNPRANYLERQAENLYLLKKGEIIYRPDYDHSTGKFTEPKPIYPSDYIIISGLHTFYLPKMRKVIDIKLFVDTEEKLRKHWKILRDIKKRGYTKEKILKQIEELDSPHKCNFLAGSPKDFVRSFKT